MHISGRGANILCNTESAARALPFPHSPHTRNTSAAHTAIGILPAAKGSPSSGLACACACVVYVIIRLVDVALSRCRVHNVQSNTMRILPVCVDDVLIVELLVDDIQESMSDYDTKKMSRSSVRKGH